MRPNEGKSMRYDRRRLCRGLVALALLLPLTVQAEDGVRGYLDAYDVKTGERKWRRYTIPGEGEKGVETWAGDSWKVGGGPTWVTGSYDPEQNVLFWAA